MLDESSDSEVKLSEVMSLGKGHCASAEFTSEKLKKIKTHYFRLFLMHDSKETSDITQPKMAMRLGQLTFLALGSGPV